MTKQQTIINLIELSGCKNDDEFGLKHGYTGQRISEWRRGVRNILNNTLENLAKKEGYKLNINYQLEKL